MTLPELSINRPVFAWMLMAAIIIFGALSFRNIGISEMPDVDFPVISVSVDWEGAAPDIMESDVVDVIEDAVTGIQGVREISSSTRQGRSTISIEFELKKDIDVALQEVESNILKSGNRLPRDIDAPIATKTNPEDQPIMWIGVSATRPLRDLMEYVDDHLKGRFQTISGVGEIFFGGFIDRNMRVWLDIDKLEAYHLSAADVIEAIQHQHMETPGGRIETGSQELNVRLIGEAFGVEGFGNIVIAQRAGSPIYRPIRLKDVAVVEDGLADIRRISRVMGNSAVGLGIRKQRGANAVNIADDVRKRLQEVKKELPQGFDIGINFDRTRFVENSIGELKFALILSCVLTSLVCWLFLGSWSATLNVLFAIPVSCMGTFIILYFMGFTLNTFTLLGLLLAVGIVVDDAIMVLENIVRHREQGRDKIEAAIVGANEITFAAIASTLAIIAIFLPVVFMKGIMGKFFFQFGVTISVAVGFSLLEALTLAPMRCSQFLDVNKRRTKIATLRDKTFNALKDSYGYFLGKALNRRFWVIILATVFFIGSMIFFKLLRKEFVPAQDQSMFLCRIQTPPGSSIEFTDKKFRQIEEFIMSRPEIKRYFAAIGGFGGGEVDTGVLFVSLKNPGERTLTQQQSMDMFRKELNNIPDVKAFVQDLSMRGFTAQRGFPIELSVRGPDWDKLTIYAQKIMDRMRNTGLMVDVDTDYRIGMPEVQVYPDREKAAQMGVDISDIARTINALVAGERVSKYTRGGHRYDVRVRLSPAGRSKPEDIEKLWVWNNYGEMVYLREVVNIVQKPTLVTITRKDRERAIGIFANVSKGKSQEDVLRAITSISKEILPEGYHIVFGGSAKIFYESFKSLFFALWFGILISYMVLASQFNSYLNPCAILFALPFSISGALIALWLGGQSLNIYSIIGLILLMGIVKKNSILLVEFTNKMHKDGLGCREALLKACPIRLRPILMTSVSTIAAAIPPALALGPGAETRIPMAIAVIGGVTLSTLLTLFVVPCAYSILVSLKQNLQGGLKDVKYSGLRSYSFASRAWRDIHCSRTTEVIRRWGFTYGRYA